MYFYKICDLLIFQVANFNAQFVITIIWSSINKKSVRERLTLRKIAAGFIGETNYYRSPPTIIAQLNSNEAAKCTSN